jgi:hypothetical protein
MNIKVFSFSPTSLFSSYRIPVEKMESEIETWLSNNSEVKISEIKHDLLQGVFYAPQLIVTIYYS